MSGSANPAISTGTTKPSARTAGFRLAFTQLTEPARAWGQIRDSGWFWAAILVQAGFYLAGGIISAQPVNNLVEVSGITVNRIMLSQAGLVGLRIVLFVALALLAWAAVVRLGLLLASIRISYGDCLTWISYASVPLALGYFLGTVQLWLVEPLTTEPAAILAWIIRPFSYGVASIFPAAFPPLSLPWFFASYLDITGLWSAWLLVVGARNYLGLKPAQAVWSACILLLIFSLAIVILWQIVQALAVNAR